MRGEGNGNFRLGRNPLPPTPSLFASIRTNSGLQPWCLLRSILGLPLTHRARMAQIILPQAPGRGVGCVIGTGFTRRAAFPSSRSSAFLLDSRAGGGVLPDRPGDGGGVPVGSSRLEHGEHGHGKLPGNRRLRLARLPRACAHPPRARRTRLPSRAR